MHHSFFGSIIAFHLVITTTVVAQDNQVIIDPAKTGAIYAVQGEYVGNFIEGDEVTRIGLQVIALGDDKFRAVAFTGGLPGADWKRGEKTETVEGKMQDDHTVVFVNEEGEESVATFKDEKLTATANDTVCAKLKKVHRKSPTLGLKPPIDAIILFDGTKAGAKKFKNGTLVQGNLLQHDCETLAKFGDHKLHVEFRTPFMPDARGQARGNSGMYLQGRYECQILDSFGLDGKNDECGGIYSISDPIVNMALPPLVWQTYDVDFTAARYDDAGKKVNNARVTIRHNGVMIQDDVELPKDTPGKYGEGPEKGPLYLQGHGNPVVFKNVWAIEN